MQPKAKIIAFQKSRPRSDIKSHARKLLCQLKATSIIPTKKGSQSFLIPVDMKRVFQEHVMSNCVKEMNKSTTVVNAGNNKPKLSDFTLISTIGVGCYAKVKLAKWVIHDNQPCALKIVNKKLAVQLKQVRNLLRERKLLCCLNNPFIVKWYFLYFSTLIAIRHFKMKRMCTLQWSTCPVEKYIMQQERNQRVSLMRYCFMRLRLRLHWNTCISTK
eukprot:TRINITY_DN89884_c0_g1_i1.p2 TRINITY_DN89884_c0_g1~~TRINITY_DN89884_c0_g1_i1.p2  ORF type:complete len:216 (-),score=3.73 TRINITY_DN89884_c0_g1_i1:803-1450(-)